MADPEPVDPNLCVTLERNISIPGKYHTPPQTSVFRADDRSVRDEFTIFFGLNIGPPNTVVEVRNDNIRSVASLGRYEDEEQEADN